MVWVCCGMLGCVRLYVMVWIFFLRLFVWYVCPNVWYGIWYVRLTSMSDCMLWSLMYVRPTVWYGMYYLCPRVQYVQVLQGWLLNTSASSRSVELFFRKSWRAEAGRQVVHCRLREAEVTVNPVQRRRMKTEGKANVVASVWGRGRICSIPCRASRFALGDWNYRMNCTMMIWKKRINSSYSS